MGYLHIIIIGISTVLVVGVVAADAAAVIVLGVPWSSLLQVSHKIDPVCERVFPNRTNLPKTTNPPTIP